MKATEFIQQSLEFGQGWIIGLLQDMRDMPLVQPTSQGGNHPLWILGHITHSESNLLDCFMQGKPNRFAEWEAIFGMGSTPSTDASVYPSFDEVMEKFEAIRAASLAHLATLSDDDLDQKSHAPEEFGAMFDTVGACFGAMVGHTSFHGGQVADARRAAGKDPLMA